MMTALSRTTATVEGPAWSAGAFGWIENWAGFAAPAREAVAREARIEPGAAVLDVGCGSGEFCELAAARGARVGKTVESRAEPYRRPDGSYRFENRFRYMIAMAP